MVIGYPAAFSLAAVGLFFGLIAIELGLIAPDFLGNLTYQLYSVLSNELLLAIPFFTFMGVILERCGLAEDLLEGFGQLFGGLRGGLSYAVILVGAVLGAITGTVAASVIAMGLISLPVMMRYGYNVRHATGVIAASGTITQLIPPSLVLIVLADPARHARPATCISARPAPASFRFCCSRAGSSSSASSVRITCRRCRRRRARCAAGRCWSRCMRGMVPSLALIFVVLGTIFMGLATPTEAGAMGVVGAMLLAWMNRRLTWKLIYQGMDQTMRLTAMVVFILLGARVFSLVFQGVGGGHWIEEHADQPAGRRRRLPDLRQHLHLRHRLLPRFLRDRLHHRAAAGPGGGRARHRPRLVRRHDLRQHADELHASALRLRAVLPARHRAKDRASTRDIYLGAIPWLVLQLILVGLLIAFPEMVTYFLDAAKDIDLDKIEIQIPALPAGGGLDQAPAFDLNAPPSFGETPPSGQPAPAQPAPDLSKPPSFN